MGDLHDLTTGPVSPTVATIFATLGCLLGILLITQARRRTGWRRVRLVAYATVALALSAIFLPALVTVLALRVEGSVLLLTLPPLAYSLAGAAGGTALALLVLCSGRPGSLRQVLAGSILVIAFGTVSVFMWRALTTGVPLGVELTPTGIALALACVTGFGLAAALAAARSLRMALGTATLLGLSVATIYHVAAAGLTLRPGAEPIPADDVVGLSPPRIGLPAVIAVAVVLAMVWYFTLGAATARDLRLMFEPGSAAEQIEPWMIEQVTSRVALTSTTYVPVPGWPEVWARNQPTVAVQTIPVVGRAIASAFARSLPVRTTDTRPTPDDAETWHHDDAVAALAAAWRDGDRRAPEPAMDSDDFDWVDEIPPAGEPDPGLGTNGPGRADGTDRTSYGDDWPVPGANEPAAARRGGAAWVNQRYQSVIVDPIHDLSSIDEPDLDAWAARLRAMSAAGATADGAVAIVHDYRAGSQLPRRNSRPIHRP